MSLIEVMVSAVLVALISLAVLKGFTFLTRTTASERLRNQAAVLAAQSQEQLRTDPATALDALQGKAHSYTQEVGGERFTIAQETEFVNGKTGRAGCSTAEGSASAPTSGNYIQIVSTVSWPQLSGQAPLRQASIITPPDGSTLQVDVLDNSSPPSSVPGVTVTAAGAVAHTGASGCAIFGSIPSTTVSFSASKPGYVTPSGAESISQAEIGIAPNITTHRTVVLAQGGAIKVQFTYKGKLNYEGTPVLGDTFVVSNQKMGLSPNFEVGGSNGLYAATASTRRDLFPFTESEEAWAVYGGDCPLDNPASLGGEGGAVASAHVSPGKTTSVDVPLSRVLLDVHTGTGPGSPGSLAKTRYPITITDGECASDIPNNAGSADAEHTQQSSAAGHLSEPFQPYGRYSLCLFDPAESKTYTAAYVNSTEAGNNVSLYLAAKGSGEGITENGVTVATGQSEC